MAITADLEQDLLGLDARLYNELARRADAVVHAAALVGINETYERYFDANVRSTANMLALSRRALELGGLKEHAFPFPPHGVPDCRVAIWGARGSVCRTMWTTTASVGRSDGHKITAHRRTRHGAMGRPEGNTTLVDAHDLFERTLIGLCREHGLGDRLSPGEVADVVDTMVEAFPDTGTRSWRSPRASARWRSLGEGAEREGH